MQSEQLDDLSYRITGAGIEVHRAIGPGLLESTYRTCMMFELRERGMNVVSERPIPVRYKTLTLDGNYRIDSGRGHHYRGTEISRNSTAGPSRAGAVIPSAYKKTAWSSNEYQRRGTRRRSGED